MEGVPGASEKNVDVPLGKEERDNLIACAIKILKEESDDKILKSIRELLQDLRMNDDMREGLQNLHENGWAFLPTTKKRNYDFKQDPSTSSSVLTPPELEQGRLNLESRLNYENHPMDNELILKKIFEFFTVNDLKKCRLVSKKWRDVSLSSWRGKAVLQTRKLFEDPPSVEEDFDGDVAVEEFVKNASTSFEVPFRRYEIDYFSYYHSCLDTNRKKMILEFFNSSIQHLSLQCEDLDILSILFTKLPQLRVLRLKINYDYDNLFLQYKSIISDGQESPFQNLQPAISKLCKLELDWSSYNFDGVENFPWKKLFQSTPALKSLCLKHNGRRGSILLEKVVITSVCEARREEDFSTLNLEELRICYLPYNVATLIIEGQFPLQKLYIDLGYANGNNNNCNRAVISYLLEAHAKTLQYIEYEIGWIEEIEDEYATLPVKPFLCSHPKLPNLKVVVLKDGHVLFPSLLSSLDVPNLEILRIERNNDHVRATDHPDLNFINPALRPNTSIDSFPKTSRDSFFLPSLRQFLCDETWNFSKTDLQFLGNTMPNVTDLRIPYGDKTFPAVYELWPGLQSLHLVANEITYVRMDDYAISGYLVKNYSDDIHAISRKSNITSLKNLRKFVLETRPRYRDSRNLLRPRKAWITDFSAVYGFLQLPKLEILELETLCKFSKNVMLALKNHVSEIKIKEPKIFVSDACAAYSKDYYENEWDSDEFWE